jgi:phage protein D
MFQLAPTSPTAGSQVRKPFLKVLLNGAVVLPAYSAEVTNNSHFTSDKFRVDCALSGMAAGYGASYWADSVNDRVQISMGVQAQTASSSNVAWNQPGQSQQSSGTPYILGQVDNAEIDQVRQVLTLTGRDLSAVFLDAQTTQKFQNQTSSQIAATLAARHGLQTNIAATMTPVGTYYTADRVNLTRKQSEWDLLIFLAQHEGFDLWVSGNTLNFQPSLNLATATPYVMIYSSAPSRFASFMDLKMSRSQTLARDVTVTVRSWNQVQQKGFTVTAKRQQAAKGQRAGGPAQNYTFTVPNLDQVSAQNYANRKLEEITRMERVINAELAGDDTLTIRTPIQLVGTGTSFDQLYYPDTITRSISFESFRMKVRAKNHSTESMVVE